MATQVYEQELVEGQPVGCRLRFEVFPAVASRDVIFGAGFLGHLEKEHVRQLGDVLVVGDPVVFQDVAEVPELADDVVGGH